MKTGNNRYTTNTKNKKIKIAKQKIEGEDAIDEGKPIGAFEWPMANLSRKPNLED